MVGAFAGLLAILLMLGVPTLIIVLIVVAVVRSNRANNDDSNKKRDSFEKIIRTLYIYLILIITLVSMIAGVTSTFSSAIDYFIPESKIISSDQFSSKSYIQERNVKIEKNESLISLYTSLSVVLVSLPVFMYHSKLAKKMKEQTE